MSVEQEQQWITGEEFGRERRALIEAGVPDDDARFRELFARVQARNDHLYEVYGKQFFAAHYGRWIAISPAGEVIIADRMSEVLREARSRFGPGNASIRKLHEFPGLDLRR